MDAEIQESMKRVYESNHWKGDESRSGRGSSQINTQHIEEELPIIIKKLNIGSILDIPCGDFAWMPRLLEKLPNNFLYHGADIVQEIISSNQNYATDRVTFSCLDITSDPLPSSDLVFVRDCFNHLPYESVFNGLKNIKESSSKYLALTHFNWQSLPNQDIDNRESVHWRKINYTLNPFFFDNPIELIVEGSSEIRGKDKTIAIWKISDIKL